MDRCIYVDQRFTRINGIQVVDVEAGKWILADEAIGVQLGPRAVAQKHSVALSSHQLINDIILVDLGRRKVRADIDERRQTAGGQRLQSLQRGRRWIGDKSNESRVLRLFAQQLLNDGHLILVGQRLLVGRIVQPKVVLECVDHQQQHLGFARQREARRRCVHVSREDIADTLFG